MVAGLAIIGGGGGVGGGGVSRKLFELTLTPPWEGCDVRVAQARGGWLERCACAQESANRQNNGILSQPRAEIVRRADPQLRHGGCLGLDTVNFIRPSHVDGLYQRIGQLVVKSMLTVDDELYDPKFAAMVQNIDDADSKNKKPKSDKDLEKKDDKEKKETYPKEGKEKKEKEPNQGKEKKEQEPKEGNDGAEEQQFSNQSASTNPAFSFHEARMFDCSQ